MKDIVIDADVMRASGTSDHPVASNARLILEKIRTQGHRMVQTSSLKDEHTKHQSKFAKMWRSAMVSRRQWVHHKPPENTHLRKHLAESQNSQKDQIAVLKDVHLLEAATASGMCVISQDTTAKTLFQKGCPLPNPFGQILWADATLYPDETLNWIEKGCLHRPDWILCT